MPSSACGPSIVGAACSAQPGSRNAVGRTLERRFYLANHVELHPRGGAGAPYFELVLEDAWVWDMYRPARFLQNVRVLTFRDVNIEELEPTPQI